MRWTLRVWRLDRFDLHASDPLGRGLWTISVDGEEGVFADLRGASSCRFAAAGSLRLGEFPLDVPVASLPRVLAGRLPVPIPPESRTLDPEGRSTFEFEGPQGSRWSGVMLRDTLLSWRLTRSGRDLVVVSLEAPDIRARTAAGLELEWRTVTREKLSTPAPPVAVPPEECRDADLP